MVKKEKKKIKILRSSKELQILTRLIMEIAMIFICETIDLSWHLPPMDSLY